MGSAFLLFHSRCYHKDCRTHHTTYWPILSIFIQPCICPYLVQCDFLHRFTCWSSCCHTILRAHSARASCQDTQNNTKDLGFQRCAVAQLLPRGRSVPSSIETTDKCRSSLQFSYRQEYSREQSKLPCEISRSASHHVY